MKLRKCVLLLPLAYNDGTAVPGAVLAEILRDIDDAFHGHTVAGTCQGAYRMAGGQLVHDESLIVWVVVDAGRVEELGEHARRFARMLKQESLYFELTEAAPEFIRPLPGSGEEP